MINYSKNALFSICIGALLLASCKKQEDPDTKLPGAYLPAYPGSYWDYSDGTRSRVEPQYELHSYRESPNSTNKTASVYVPVLDGQYLYEYSVYQSSPVYPLKQLLSTTVNQTWVVEMNNNIPVNRYSAFLDSLVVAYPGKDSVFKKVFTVVEYVAKDTLDENDWNRKEYYANNVGLIRVDINDPYDTLPPVIQKEIRSYFINK